MINTAESSRELLGLDKVNHVDHVAIAVASPESIRSWSKGEVKNPETRSEEHTSELQSRTNLVCRLLLEKKKKNERTPVTH